MKLSVIIVNYNVRFFLEQAVRSTLKALELVEGELIVVDNASSDDSQSMMKELFPDVQYIYLNENLGFSKANNVGIKASKGEYVLLLNPDTVVAEDSFKICVDFMDQHPDAGGLGVHMIDGTGHFLPESKRGLPTPKAAFYKIFGLSSLFPNSKTFGTYHLGYLDEEETHAVDILSGAFMVMRKEALDKSGLLDETFFMYGEDIDLSYRLTKAGYKNYYLPEARIIHYKGESTKKDSVNYVFVFYRAMVIFAKKHFDRGQASLFGFAIELAIYFRAGIAILRRLFGGFWQMIIDALLIFGIFRFATGWYASWANKDFDLPFIDSVTLGYTAIALFVLLYSSVYDRQFRYYRLLKGWGIAFLVLLGFYSLLPESLRYSRAVLLIGSVGAMFGTMIWRSVFNAINSSSFEIYNPKASRIGVVGDTRSLEDVNGFFDYHKRDRDLICGIAIEEEEHYPVGFVGQADEARLIVEDFRLTEIVFDERVISNKRMIELMEILADNEVEFRMLLGDPLFMVGSQAALRSDDVVASGDLENINIDAIKRVKRTLDLLITPFVVILSPILLFLVDDRIGLFKNIFRVVIGKASWIGYDPRAKHVALPNLKPGVAYSLLNVILPDTGQLQLIQENLTYISNYSIQNDLRLIFRHMHALGRNPLRESPKHP